VSGTELVSALDNANFLMELKGLVEKENIDMTLQLMNHPQVVTKFHYSWLPWWTWESLFQLLLSFIVKFCHPILFKFVN